MSKKTLTRSEVLQLEGLLTLARNVQRQASELKIAVCELVGEDIDEYGHASDAVYSDGTTARELMRKMKITASKSS